MKISTLLTFATLGAICSSSLAVTTTDSVQTNSAPSDTTAGFYLGVGAGYGMNQFHDWLRDGIGWTDYCNNRGPAVRVFSGYEINRHFAIEAGYTDFTAKPSLQYSGLFKEWPPRPLKKTKAIDLNLRASAPIYQKIDLCLKLGGNYLMASRNSFKLTYGAGFDWHCSHNITLGLEWQRFNSDHIVYEKEIEPGSFLSHADAIMLTVRYRLDGNN